MRMMTEASSQGGNNCCRSGQAERANIAASILLRRFYMSDDFIRLSASREAALISQAKSPDNPSFSFAFSELERAYKPLLHKYSRRINVSRCERSEIDQILRTTFYYAIRRYDPAVGVRLSTFVMPRLNGTVKRLQKQLSQDSNKSLDILLEVAEQNHLSHEISALSDGGAEAHRTYECLELDLYVIPEVRAFLARRTQLQRTVASLMFAKSYTAEETGRLLGISQQAVQQCRSRLLSVGRRELYNLQLP